MTKFDTCDVRTICIFCVCLIIIAMLSEWIVKTYFKSIPKEHFEEETDIGDAQSAADGDGDGDGGGDGDVNSADGVIDDGNGVTTEATTHTTSGDDIKDAFDEIENLFIFKIDTFIGENSPIITQTNNLNNKLQAYVDTLRKIEDVKLQMLNNINAIRTYKLTLNRLKTEEVTEIETFSETSLGDVKKDFETRIKMIKNQQYNFKCLITKLSFLNSGIKKIMTLFQGDITGKDDTIKGILDNVINFHDEEFKLNCMDSSIEIKCTDSVPTPQNKDSNEFRESDFNKSTLNNDMFNEMCNTVSDDKPMHDTIYNEILSLKGANNTWDENPHNTDSKLLKDSDGNTLTHNHVYSSQQCGRHVHNAYLDTYINHMNDVLDKITATLPQAGLHQD